MLSEEVHGLRKTADRMVLALFAVLAGMITNMAINLLQGA